MDRKNPLATIEAFKLAFTKDENVKLIIKTINGSLWPKQKELLSRSTLGYGNIHVIDQYLARSEVLSLIKNAIAYVSLHRSEGYGLTLAESMALGTPVIATGYSGNLDFMEETNSLMVDYDLIDVSDSSGAYRVESRWANPKIQSAAGHMRSIFDDPVLAGNLGLAAKSAVKDKFHLSHSAEFIQVRVSGIKRSTSPYAPRRALKKARQFLSKLLPRKFKDFLLRWIMR
jgi:glycosyltransferase involved in cell wall biosynthesis